MKAIRIHDYGAPSVLRYEDAPEPVPQPGDVLVRVLATSVNPIDWHVRAGQMRSSIPYRLPLILGWDVSGVVERLGPGANRFKLGDAVFGRPDMKRDGTYAQYVAVRESELTKKPRSLDHQHAAAVPLAGLTAWQVLFDAPAPYWSMNLKSGQTLLIHGAAGGVGSFAVQFAKWRGAKVIATASGPNSEVLRALGADEVIDYTKQRFEAIVPPLDAVLDLIGGETQARSWGVLKPGGVLASTVTPPSEAEAEAHRVRASFVLMQPNASQLEQISTLIDDGAVKPVVSQVLPLSEARRAHELSEAGHARGKLVLAVE
jgi:NADPH:quinone reductase-like Zn-dependent oxidoreductase